MTKRSRHIIIFFITILLFFIYANDVSADENGTVDYYKIIANYKIENEVYIEKQIKIYKIADLNETSDYVFLQEFEKYNLSLNNIKDSTQLDNLANIILEIINNDKIIPYRIGYTNEYGNVEFDNLTEGVYLLESEKLQEKDKAITYTPAIVTVPNLNEDYEINVNPKGIITRPTYEEKDYKVIIYWDDEGKNRPSSVEVDIFKNGIKQETVVLSSKNNWTYTWKAEDDNSEWTVMESGLPSEYTIRQEKESNSFYITNIYRQPIPQPPSPGGDPIAPDINNPITPNTPNKLPTSLEELNQILRERTKNKVKLPVTGEEKTVFIFLIIAIISIIGLIAINIVSKRLEKDK